MARYNKIYAGPYTEATPQVQERVCAAAVLPGTALVESGANFAQAGANSNLKVYIAQDNYLLLKGVDDAWAAGDRVIGMEMLDEQFFNVRVPTGVNVARGAGLTTNAAGKFVLAATGNRIIAFAEEAFNNTTGSDQLVRARAAKGNLAAA
ncbi:hypothetical protein OSJ77_19975 [Phyllobacterium sp. 0TCS1.6C]|uniref:hypothetical protein n=1 Tax=unclassified Phyllobacterium TaxID=2638441 RepID=UPI002265004D|nr:MULTISPECIES: hypothetical protein [unclassified Phyllobacterium]MCX8282473.1 hypothetical protein [Phyllobacterium sp. 0TCS1.6C]MCX8292565.1 hypothetical protein [Phyllobacterium sp. 0TCS1.6A]